VFEADGFLSLRQKGLCTHVKGHEPLTCDVRPVACAGCTEPNDFISDTPEMAELVYGCMQVDSCPDRPANEGDTDPIHNYMVWC
jgi:hypothetical protein